MFKTFKKALALVVIISFMFLIPGDSKIMANETIAVPNKVIVFKIGDKNYYEQEVGKEARKVAMDVAPYIDKARTFVPVRYLGNALGVGDDRINWDEKTRTAILKGRHELKLTIGNQKMLKDNVAVEMDVSPQVIPPGRTMLPARYVAEGLGFKVEWDSERKLVVAYPEGQERPDISQILALINKKAQSLKITSESDLTPEVIQKIRETEKIVSIAKWTAIEPKYHARYVEAIKRDFEKAAIIPPEGQPIQVKSIVISDKLFYSDGKGWKVYRVIVNGNEIWDVNVIFTGKDFEAFVAWKIGTI